MQGCSAPLVRGKQLRASRRKQFAEQYLDPILAEASRLGIDSDTLVSLIRGARLA